MCSLPNREKETILVTGGAGYIGSHTCVELLNAGYNVVVIDNFCNSSPASIYRVNSITGKEAVLYSGDVRDERLVEYVITSHKVSAVIHFAGLKAVGESCANPLLYYNNNVYGMLALLNVMRRCGCCKIIFSSSATVYGNPKTLPVNEDAPVGNVANPYGATKFFQESILSDLQRASGEWTVILLRYFNPIGAHPSGLIGEDPRGIPNNLLPYVAKVAIGELKEVQVYGDDYDTPDGTGVRDYIHVVDLARGHLAALDRIKTPGRFVYNLGTGKGYSVLQVIESFERACGRKIPYRIVGRRPGDIDATYADPSKAERELGWRATLTLDDMCNSLWKWQQENPNGYNNRY